MSISRDGVGIGRGRPAAPIKSGGGVLGVLGMLLLAACTATPPNSVVTGAAPAPKGALALDQFTGMRPADLVALLGQPSLRRSDPPAELWQYRGTGCVLELYLYREGDAYRVVHAEASGRSLASDDGCSADVSPTPTGLRQSRL